MLTGIKGRVETMALEGLGARARSITNEDGAWRRRDEVGKKAGDSLETSEGWGMEQKSMSKFTWQLGG